MITNLRAMILLAAVLLSAFTSALPQAIETATATASATTPDYTATYPALFKALPFVPGCAHYCLHFYLPPIDSLADFNNACETWSPGNNNNNTKITNAKTSADKVRALIDGCVYEWCGKEVESDPGFQAALKGACNSTTLSASGTPTPTPSVGTVGETAAATAAATHAPAPSEKNNSAATLSPGAIAGIAVGGAAFLLIVAGMILVSCRRRRKGEQQPGEKSKDDRPPKTWRSPASTPSPNLPDHGFEFGVPSRQETEVHAAEAMQQPRAWSPESDMMASDVNQLQYSEDTPQLPPLRTPSPLDKVPQGGYMASSSPPEQRGFITSDSPTPSAASSTRNSSSEEEEGDQLQQLGTIARADSVAWRRSLHDAAERAATRVSLRVSEPILETPPPAENRRSLMGMRRWSSGGGIR